MILTLLVLLILLEWNWRLGSREGPSRWRIYLLCAIGAIAAYFLWGRAFPETFWFRRLTIAGASGGFAGWLAGYAWQMVSAERRSGFSESELMAMCRLVLIIFPIGLGCTLPGLLAEEEELTNLH